MDQSNRNENRYSADGEVQVKSTKGQTKLLSKNKILLVVIATVAMVLLAIGIFFFRDNFASKEESNALACSNRSEGTILYKAKQIFVDSGEAVTKDKLDPLIDEIKLIDKYKDDANCLFPIIYGYILDNNFASASSEYDSFARLYGDGNNFAKDIYPMQNIEDLKSLIEFSLEIQNNDKIVPTPNNVVGAGEQVSEVPESEISR
jgi:hypothetical protein